VQQKWTSNIFFIMVLHFYIILTTYKHTSKYDITVLLAIWISHCLLQWIYQLDHCSLTHSMEQSPSWEPKQFSASPIIPRILWNPKVHYCIHLSLSWARLIQSMPPHPTSWSSILILSSHLCLGLPSGLVPWGFPTKTLYTPLPSPICATRPTHLILLDLITWKTLDEEYTAVSA